MRKFLSVIALTCLMTGWVVVSACYAGDSWEFSKVTKIKVKGLSGDVVLRPADGKTGSVELRSAVRPRDHFRPEVEQDGNTLYIREHWGPGSSSGEVKWTIYLPKQDVVPRIYVNSTSGDLDCRRIAAYVDYKSASGEVKLSDVQLEDGSEFNTASGDFCFEDMTVSEGVEFHTASGDIELLNLDVEEECEFTTASGDVKCIDCRGYLHASSASGDVFVKNPVLMDEGDFSSASGDVKLYFTELPKEDISASSASGSVYLNVEDFGGDFTLVLIKREDRGRISCPFEYDRETTFEDYHTYEKKIVKRGSGRPEIRLRTASGKVVVKD